MVNRGNQRVGIVLLVVGALLLLMQFVEIDVGAVAWPLFILIPGAALLALALFVKQAAAPLAIPGSIVATVGLVLFYQNVTGRFESWSYAWGLIVTAVGIGLALVGRLQANPKLQHDGQRLATVGLVLFVAFGAFFELLIFRSFAGSVVWRYLLPLLLIAAGLLLFVRRGQGSASGEVDAPPKPQP